MDLRPGQGRMSHGPRGAREKQKKDDRSLPCHVQSTPPLFLTGSSFSLTAINENHLLPAAGAPRPVILAR